MPQGVARRGGKKDRKWNHTKAHKGRVARHKRYRETFRRDRNKERKLKRHVAIHVNDDCAKKALLLCSKRA